MSTLPAEQSQPLPNHNATLQRLTASREEIMLMSHLIQASLVIERSNPLRKMITTHWDLARVMLITCALLLCAAIGWLIPQIQ